MYSINKIWPEWKIVRLNGEGSFGKVYEISRNKFGIEEHSALKVITIPTSTAEVRTFKNEGMDDESVTAYYSGVVKDFTNEIALMAKLKGSHNVVAYEDYEIYKHEDDFVWDILIRMELLEALPDYMVVHPLDKEKVLDLAIDRKSVV